jgi:tetratricopeptide (TPR) repeat protein
MKQSICYLGLLACLAAPAAWPQSPQKREVTVLVVNAHADPSQPVPGVRVSLSFVAGSEKVTDARDATNRSGQALLLVSPEAAQRDDLRLEIGGVSDLVVFQPADGQLSGLPTNVTVRLLPKGSVLLLGPPQIEAMLQRLSIQNRSKNQEIHALKAELAAAQSQKPDDLTASMAEWAKANGFEVAEVDKQVQQWAEDIQKRKDQATANEKALAELALKHYGVAAQLFDQAADDIGQSMDEEEKRFLEERRKQLRELVDRKFQSANTYQLNLQFHQATLILAQARDRAAAEHNRYPEDAALRSIWLDAVLRLANARGDEGEVSEASASAALLAQSVADYRTLLQQRSAPEDRQDWAMTQTNLAIALDGQAQRSGGTQVANLLSQAVEAYRAALEVLTKSNQPQDWARTQVNLGNALMDRGLRSSGTEATKLFVQAVVAYRTALEVRTKAGVPQLWANTQNNLGIVLMHQAERSSAAQATDLFVQSIEAFRAALQVETKADAPEDWARTENNLGIVLRDQGERATGPVVVELFDQAVQACRAALEVRTKADLPQDWAATENNLGAALMDQALHSGTAAQATDLLTKALEAFRSALDIRTKANLPQGWATTQSNLGTALTNQAVLSSGAESIHLLSQAVEAYRAALEVYTKTDLPQDWAGVENNLGIALADQAERSGETPAKNLLVQAIEAYRAALEVYSEQALPQDFAMTQNNLALALRHLAERNNGPEAKDLLAQSIVAYRAALDVYTKSDTPLSWAKTENNLSNALVIQGDYTGAAKAIDAALEAFPNDTDFLQTAVSIYHDNLFHYDRSYELTVRWFKLDTSPNAALSMVEEDLTSSRFDDCQKHAASIADASLPEPKTAFALFRDTMKMACQWAAGQKSDARQSVQSILSDSSRFRDIGWGVEGTRHFLASSPAFAAGRASWIALFDSLEKADGAAMAAALHQLDEVMKP